jgi:hypothetical protein
MKCSCSSKIMSVWSVDVDDITLLLKCYFCGRRWDMLTVPKTEEAFKAIKEATQYLPGEEAEE